MDAMQRIDGVSFATGDDRWDAVERRDARADGAFVYAVASTGVYCRPSCPSRPKRRANVTFHDTGAAAEAAGFRACRRCGPDGPSPKARRERAVARACVLIEAADGPVTLDAVAEAAGFSPFHLHRMFKAVTGVTPKAYAAARRDARARAGLAEGAPVTAALYEAGYNSASRFYARAPAALGMAPGAYRAGGPGERIRFAVGASSLGPVLVAATAVGVASVQFGSDADALVAGLRERFPRADLVGDDPGFDRTIAAVVAAVDEPAVCRDLPLDVRGTAFQARVWQALRALPPGRTATYAGIAAAIGAPTAVRAVAGACAANEIAVLVPCHRVVRTDGTSGGYRWGVERKAALLRREGAGSAGREPGPRPSCEGRRTRP